MLLVILHKKDNEHNGIVITSYMILYSLGRVFMEGLRIDSLMLENMRIEQLISIAGIIVGAVIIFNIVKKKN